MADTPLSFLDLVNQCDNFPPRSLKSEFDSEIIVPLFLTGTSASDEGCVGLLRPVIVELLQNENKKSQSEGKTENWIVNLNKPPRVSFNEPRRNSRTAIYSYEGTRRTPSRRGGVPRRVRQEKVA